ncbi:MAG: hypothetical protein R3E39_05210 [Anaerolineae bacterium]
MSEPFVLGVNYWPRKKAMYWWSDFDASEVREEFAIIRDIGLNVVRIFLLWDDFQPTPDTVSPECLSNLEIVANIANENGLKLDVTFFTGHMSGPNWSPGWLLDGSAPIPSKHVRQVVSGGKVVRGGYRNMYHDPVALEAERLFAEYGGGPFERSPGDMDVESWAMKWICSLSRMTITAGGRGCVKW